MASQTQIVNMALMKLGYDPVINVDLDNSTHALAVRMVYDLCVEDVLTQHQWNFAIKKVQLLPLDEPLVGDEWAVSYALPVDVLRVLAIEPLDERIRWGVEGRRLCTTGSGPVVIHYLKNEKDTTLYSPVFVMALVYRLALELSTTLTARDGFTQNFAALYAEKLRDAKNYDGMEGSPVLEDHSPLAWVRLST